MWTFYDEMSYNTQYNTLYIEKRQHAIYMLLLKINF